MILVQVSFSITVNSRVETAPHTLISTSFNLVRNMPIWDADYQRVFRSIQQYYNHHNLTAVRPIRFVRARDMAYTRVRLIHKNSR